MNWNLSYDNWVSALTERKQLISTIVSLKKVNRYMYVLINPIYGLENMSHIDNIHPVLIGEYRWATTANKPPEIQEATFSIWTHAVW